MDGKEGNGGSRDGRMMAILAGILVGGLVGATTMYMLAPRSGKKSRTKIQKQGEKMRTQATAVMDDVVMAAGDKASQFTDGLQLSVGEK